MNCNTCAGITRLQSSVAMAARECFEIMAFVWLRRAKTEEERNDGRSGSNGLNKEQ